MMRAILVVASALGVAQAGVLVTFEAKKAGDNFSWDYTLTARNHCSDCPINGLLVLKGDSVFDLLEASFVAPPKNWDYIAPVPGVVDDLFFFSKKPEADLKKGQSLEFKFNSLRRPGGLKPEDLAVDVICRETGEQIRARSTLVPEPASAVLVLGALLGLAVSRRRR